MNESIRAYIERAPEAISGQGGHNTTLRVARTLYNGFALSRDQVLEWLHVYNARLSEKWTPRELEHKADSAASGRYDKPRGWMLNRHDSGPRRISIRAAKFTSERAKNRQKVCSRHGCHRYSRYSRSVTRARVHGSVGIENIHSIYSQQDQPEPRDTTGKPASVEPLPSKTTQTEQPGSAGKISMTSTVADDDPEARRIANELVRIHRDAPGGLTAADAACFAAVLKTLEATYTGRALASAPQGTNPDDVAELERLHRKKYGQRT